MSDRKIKVLVVDDSSLFRKVITDILESDPEIEVIETANNGKSAIIKNRHIKPDVITMDIEMPIMDGITALKEIIDSDPRPVIMMSVLTQHGADATFKALEYGAVDFVPKPSSILSLSVDDIGELLIGKVKSAYRSKVVPKSSKMPQVSAEALRKDESLNIDLRNNYSKKIVGIGTSTGGPSALLTIFRRIPANFPAPILVVQHMPAGFTKAFSERLNENSLLNVKEAEDGDIVTPGCGYIAPGHSHMVYENTKGRNMLRVYKSEKVSGHMPSIDVLFDSIAEHAGSKSIATIMTGMGSDGAKGILNIFQKGGYTIAQDEKSSVVFGMNRVAVEKGAISDIVPLDGITKKIVDHI